MIQPILDVLKSERRFMLSGHTSPDGDCLGAQVGLYHLLQALGREGVIMNPDPLSPNHAFLCRHTPISDFKTEGSLPEFDVLILLDCAEVSRLGDMESAMRAALRDRGRSVAVIDHHIGSENGDGDVSYVDSTASATGALVYRLFEACGQTITAPAAEGIFLSLVSDTGWFKYSNTDAATLEMASRLVDAGVQPDALFDQLFRQNDAGSVDLLSQALATHRFGINGRYVSAVLDRNLMDLAARTGFDTDQVLDPLRSVRGVEVVALFKELYQNGVKISLRASGDIDVQAIASHFGGGGHKKAAGATLSMPLPQAVIAVEEQVQRAMRDLEERPA